MNHPLDRFVAGRILLKSVPLFYRKDLEDCDEGNRYFRIQGEVH